MSTHLSPSDCDRMPFHHVVNNENEIRIHMNMDMNSVSWGSYQSRHIRLPNSVTTEFGNFCDTCPERAHCSGYLLCGTCALFWIPFVPKSLVRNVSTVLDTFCTSTVVQISHSGAKLVPARWCTSHILTQNNLHFTTGPKTIRNTSENTCFHWSFTPCCRNDTELHLRQTEKYSVVPNDLKRK